MRRMRREHAYRISVEPSIAGRKLGRNGGRAGFARGRGAASGYGAGGLAEAAPVIRDDDAVFRAVDVVADGAGKAEAKILRLNVVAEGGDVLGALVGDAADFVLVEDEVDFLKVRGAGGVEV